MRMCYSFNDVEKLQKKNSIPIKPSVSTLDISDSKNIFTSSPIPYGKFLNEKKYTSRKLRRYAIKKFYNTLY